MTTRGSSAMLDLNAAVTGTSGRPKQGAPMSHMNGDQGDERASLGQLFASLAQSVSDLVRDQIALAKAEISESAKRGATGGGLIAAAVALFMMVCLLVTFGAVYGLSAGTGLPLWASFLIVAAVYAVIAAILGFAGSKQLQKARGPQKATEAATETKQILTGLVPKTESADIVDATEAAAPTQQARETSTNSPT